MRLLLGYYDLELTSSCVSIIQVMQMHLHSVFRKISTQKNERNCLCCSLNFKVFSGSMDENSISPKNTVLLCAMLDTTRLETILAIARHAKWCKDSCNSLAMGRQQGLRSLSPPNNILKENILKFRFIIIGIVYSLKQPVYQCS